MILSCSSTFLINFLPKIHKIFAIKILFKLSVSILKKCFKIFSVFSAHSSEVCGLKWSPDENFLTSGGSDCLVHVWEKTQLSTFNAVYF